ncbi:MAG: hypothetical protein AABZ06_08725 [Bdellovibrionota bacterium]
MLSSSPRSNFKLRMKERKALEALASKLGLTFIREIATESVALYEAPQNGLIDYINKIERLLVRR